jgi:hypothetical protein
MLRVYRSLLFLYPPAYRCAFGDEMLAVLAEIELEASQVKRGTRILLRAREVGGLLNGALTEHVRRLTGIHGNAVLSLRRSRMRSEFRFPKATAILMTVILVAVIMAIEKAKAISASLPPSSTPVGPIQPEHLSTVTTLLVILALALSTAVLGWLVAFALRRSGIQRLSDVRPGADPATGSKPAA